MNTHQSKVKLVWITPDAEKLIAYMARVSNPANQNNENIAGLLTYCIKNRHWSIFETCSLSLEINTSRGISPQILRHRSFTFQEFSQRYAEVDTIEDVYPRRQDTKNRQNSTDDLDEETKAWFAKGFEEVKTKCLSFYKECLNRGIAKECARFALPIASSTRMYMTGTIRSWIHYIDLRSGNGTQLEHMQIANEAKKIFIEQLPIISTALGWKTNEQTNS